MNLKYIFLVSIFTTICYCPFAQTCVLFLRTPDKIYVATDTRKAITNVIKKPNDHGIVKSHDTICKIYKIGNIYFSMAGYDPEEIIKYAAESCKKNSTILSTSLYFRNNFKKIAEAYVNKIRLLNYDFYLKNFYEFEYLQVLFYGFES
jgi:hypothetical protein